MADKIIIFDTTLRDGEQSPGMSMSAEEKIKMAKQLECLGVDVIEAGFAASSPEDFRAVQTIAGALKDCTIGSFARALETDIDAAWDAVKAAASPQIHLFLATSGLHMQYKLRMTKDEVLDAAARMTRYARKYCANVHFSAEDATRSDMDFLEQVVRVVLKAGASTINLADTVGYATPEEHRAFFEEIRRRVPELDEVILSCHCHNDLGLAVANSLAAVCGGVRQVACTVNGIGERAGNAALEEIVRALSLRKDFYGVTTNIDANEIARSSALLSRITGGA